MPEVSSYTHDAYRVASQQRMAVDWNVEDPAVFFRYEISDLFFNDKEVAK